MTADHAVYRSNLLEDHFVEVPASHITRMVKEKKTLADAYHAIKEQLHTYNSANSLFNKLSIRRRKRHPPPRNPLSSELDEAMREDREEMCMTRYR
jgi:hypothetical protein